MVRANVTVATSPAVAPTQGRVWTTVVSVWWVAVTVQVSKSPAAPALTMLSKASNKVKS